MSYIFEMSHDTVWSPSLATGQLFVDAAKSVAKVLDAETGLHPNSDDMYYIDPVLFEVFVRAMIERFSSTSNPEFRLLIRGTLEIALAVLERGGVTLRASEVGETELLRDAHARSARLPT